MHIVIHNYIFATLKQCFKSGNQLATVYNFKILLKYLFYGAFCERIFPLCPFHSQNIKVNVCKHTSCLHSTQAVHTFHEKKLTGTEILGIFISQFLELILFCKILSC